MIVAALKVDAGPAVRRLQLPDLDRHGAWLGPRLAHAYPHLSSPVAALQWLRGVLYSNEFYPLFSLNGAGLAQMTHPTLSPRAAVQEHFCWARDPKDREQVAEVAEFYGEWERWARRMGVETLIVEERSDVPHERIKSALGRVFTRTQTFARVGERDAPQ